MIARVVSRLLGRRDEDAPEEARPDCSEPFVGYAVLDFETTGFLWAAGDRVIEVGVVLLDAAGERTGAWTTLIDPGRPVGGTAVHQITDRDVLHAPRFADIAGLLVDSCAGRVLVAHNLAFDGGFLKNELAAADVHVDLQPDSGLCTMRLAEHYLPHVSSSLEDLCYAAGIKVEHRHWAFWDAEATARLLRYYLSGDPAFVRHWCRPIRQSLDMKWPELPRTDVRLLPRCPPTAGHPEDDWCVPEIRRVEPPPLPSRRMGRSGFRR